MKQIDVENSRYLLCEHCESIVTAYLLPEKSQDWFDAVQERHSRVVDSLKNQGYWKKFYEGWESEREHRPLLCKECMPKFRYKADRVPVHGYAMSSCGCIAQRVPPKMGDPSYPWFITVEPNFNCTEVKGRYRFVRDQELFEGIEILVHGQPRNRRSWSYDYDWWLLHDYKVMDVSELPDYFSNTYHWLFKPSTYYSGQHTINGVQGSLIGYRGRDLLQLIQKRDGGEEITYPSRYVNFKRRVEAYRWEAGSVESIRNYLSRGGRL